MVSKEDKQLAKDLDEFAEKNIDDPKKKSTIKDLAKKIALGSWIATEIVGGITILAGLSYYHYYKSIPASKRYHEKTKIVKLAERLTQLALRLKSKK